MKQKSYDLTIEVKGRFDTVDVPVKIDLSKNIKPDFSVSCNNSCSLSEDSAKGVVLIQSNRVDDDSDLISFSLENNFGNQFSIDSSSGEVKLNDTLD